ncbi:MAG: cation diffusion facilitator family transporter [Hyphomicrobiales bacterium]|nr:cation diffusion facilitator family transporter [Hyphomicrobiales bacterium]MDE2114016.1 cation diffusion facilitator family transporter [Hyphomicrobiales bacterium]
MNKMADAAASSARKEKAAIASIYASAALALAKLVAGLLSGSLALLSEAGHGLIDTFATILTYFAVREAGKPADEEHHYGHAKMESLAALSETGMLLALASFVLIEAVNRLQESVHVDASWIVFAVLGLSIAIDGLRWHGLAKIAREESSEALAADALHFSSDMVSSTMVALGLAATRFGFVRGDAVAAIAVALFIGLAGYRLARRTVDSLLDAAPAGMSAQVREIVATTPGVIGIEAIRLRPAGAHIQGEVIVDVARSTPLERVADMKTRLAERLADALPKANITLTANPKALDDESILEQVLLVAARRRLPVHHVTVQKLAGVTAVSLDLEINGALPYGAAHEIASGLELAIAQEIGSGIEVETHIEPLQLRELSGTDAPEALRLAIENSLKATAAQRGKVCDIHDLRARNTAAGLVVNYHCRVDPRLSVDEVHELVDPLDRAARAVHPEIVRIVGHAEPLL